MCVGFAQLLAISTSQGNVFKGKERAATAYREKRKKRGGDGNGGGYRIGSYFILSAYTIRQ